MTAKQFHTIRNLLSWIVIALLLIIAQQYVGLDRTDMGHLIGLLAMLAAAMFLVMMTLRMLVFVDPDQKKQVRPVEHVKKAPTELDDDLNLDGTPKN